MARSIVQRNFVAARVLVGAGLASWLLASGWAATTVDQIDVVSSRYGTELKLHADQPIQHRVIQASDTDMAIELSDVTPARHLRTNFAQAGQVHHVIVQPVGGNALKVVLRGQNLGQPLVQVVYSQEPVAAPMAPAMMMPKALTPKVAPSAAAHSVTPAKPALTAAVKPAAKVSTSKALPPVVTNDTPLAGLAAPAMPAPAPVSDLSDSLFADETTTASSVPSSTMAPSIAPGPFDFLTNNWTYALVAGSVLLALMAGLGLFIIKKWQQVNESAASNSMFKAMGKQDWAALAQDEDVIRPAEDDSMFGSGRHAKKANPWAERPKVSLQQPPKAAGRLPQSAPRPPGRTQAASQAPASPAEALLQAREQAVKGMAAPGQAAQQYARQQAAPRLSNAANSVSSRSTAGNPYASSAANGRNGGTLNDPLPTNPNVVDFLKDVASYMEQDGERGKARRITRNLRQFE